MIDNRAGRGNNLSYKQGFDLEFKMLNSYSGLISDMLDLIHIEPTLGSMLDMFAGVDATGRTKQGHIIGISLRYRSEDYNSFTLSRHITDSASEVHKWLQSPLEALSPTYHIQIAEIPAHNAIRFIRVNIPAFRHYLNRLIEEGNLSSFWNPYLKAYEFKLYSNDTPAVRNEVINLERLKC